MTKECVLYDRECINCGDCTRCDIFPNKICDNCGKCLEDDYDYRAIEITSIDNKKIEKKQN